MKDYSPRKQLLIGVRELIFAFAIMVIFYFIGHWLLAVLSISKTSLKICGGIIFFIIALRLIFPGQEDIRGKWEGSSPFIVPIAVPLIAGPTLLAAIMIYSEEGLDPRTVFLSIFIAWAISTVILLSAKPIYKLIGDKGLSAFEKLMGLILTLIAVQMIITGTKALLLTFK